MTAIRLQTLIIVISYLLMSCDILILANEKNQMTFTFVDLANEKTSYGYALFQFKAYVPLWGLTV